MTISAKIHPTDQISIGVEYSIRPINISGALYHYVTTSFVYGLFGTKNFLFFIIKNFKRF